MAVSPTKKTVTLADVARAAGISKTTASHALSGKGWVSPKTRLSVQEMAREMGFEADPLAQRLSNGRCDKTVSIYSLDMDLSCRTRQLQIIQSELNWRGYNVPIFAYGYSGREILANQLELMNNLLAQRPRAVICNTSGVRVEVLERLQKFVEEGGVAVCYGYSEFAPVECDQVVYEESESFYLAARHLLELGHRDLGFFDVGQRKPGGAILRSFERALTEFGVPLRDEWLFQNDGTRRYEEDGANLLKQFLALEKRPSAMLVANDYAAVSFIAALSRAGIRVPADLSVIGHDDDAIAGNNLLPLSTVSNPVETMAGHIMDLLSQRLLRDYSGPAQQICVVGELVSRQSVAPLKS